MVALIILGLRTRGVPSNISSSRSSVPTNRFTVVIGIRHTLQDKFAVLEYVKVSCACIVICPTRVVYTDTFLVVETTCQEI